MKNFLQKPLSVRNAGFTLVGFSIVFVVIGLLMTTTFVTFVNMKERSRDVRRVSDMAGISGALHLFFNDKGHYPGPTRMKEF